MDFLYLYDKIDDIWAELDNAKSRVYEVNTLEERDKFCSKINDICNRILEVKADVASEIKEEWL